MNFTKAQQYFAGPLKYFIFICLIFASLLFSHKTARAAVLYVGSAYDIVHTGQTFTIDWFMDTEGESLNALNLKLLFPHDLLEATDLSTGNSIISIWVKTPKISNQDGRIELIGGLPNGFESKKAPIFKTTFLAKKAGSPQITMDKSSLVLKNDNRGNAANLFFKNLHFTIAPGELIPAALIASPTHQNEDTWYKQNNVRINFSPKPQEIYSYSFSSNIEI